uniref:MADF domain-containing protein n=1 Tax=Caenorhabditis tropicalis TaxID=1561998 RepID=A0A1I7UUQ3_9PELO
MAFQPAFNARLINEVRKHPCLYNHSRRGSGDTLERQRLWESIAKSIDPNCAAEFAKKRWLQLRDRYRKELKIAIKNGFVAPVRWCYFNQLSWLDPFLKDNIGQAADEGKKTPKMESFDETSTTPFSWFGFPNLTTIKDEMEDDDSDPALESSVLDRLLAQTTQRLDSISPEIENDESGTQSLDGNVDVDGVDGEDVEEDDVKTQQIEERFKGDEEEENIEKPIKISNQNQNLSHSQNQNQAMAMLAEAINAQNVQNQQKPSVETLIAANQARFAHHLAAQLSGMSSMLNGARKSESAATPVRAPTPPPPTSSTSNGSGHFHPYKEAAKHRHQSRQAENMMRHHLQQVGRVALEWLNDEDLLYSRIIGLKLKKMDPKKRKKVRHQIMVLLEETDEHIVDNDDSCSSHSPSARDQDEECPVEPTENEIPSTQC